MPVNPTENNHQMRQASDLMFGNLVPSTSPEAARFFFRQSLVHSIFYGFNLALLFGCMLVSFIPHEQHSKPLWFIGIIMACCNIYIVWVGFHPPYTAKIPGFWSLLTWSQFGSSLYRQIHLRTWDTWKNGPLQRGDISTVRRFWCSSLFEMIRFDCYQVNWHHHLV